VRAVGGELLSCVIGSCFILFNKRIHNGNLGF
jgi:hypothetical protein